jgi:LmbE family N-acetylglucosaminyl deacetylase
LKFIFFNKTSNMKRQIFLIILSLVFILSASGQGNQLRVIVFGAHPDDCDLEAGGIAIMYAKMGHKVKFVSMTNGDAGHQSMGGGALAKRRMAEAQEAGRRFGVEYTVLDNHDGELMPTLENRLKVIREIRNWKADIVLTHPSNDYHPDHRYTSLLIQDASFMVLVPNVAPDTPPLKKNPIFMWFSVTDPDVAVDIDNVADQKLYAAAAHESQFFEWLPWLDGTLEKVPKSNEERLKFMKIWLVSPNDAVRLCLKKWYGDARASKILYTESFKLADYSRKPDHDELVKLFPVIK